MCLPWLAVHLKDLRGICERQESRVVVDGKTLINFEKFASIYDGIQETLAFQSERGGNGFISKEHRLPDLLYLEDQLAKTQLGQAAEDKMEKDSLELKRLEDLELEEERRRLVESTAFKTGLMETLAPSTAGRAKPSRAESTSEISPSAISQTKSPQEASSSDHMPGVDVDDCGRSTSDLVERLTRPNFYWNDQEFQEAFLTTYSLFTSTKEIVELTLGYVSSNQELTENSLPRRFLAIDIIQRLLKGYYAEVIQKPILKDIRIGLRKVTEPRLLVAVAEEIIKTIDELPASRGAEEDSLSDV